MLSRLKCFEENKVKFLGIRKNAGKLLAHQLNQKSEQNICFQLMLALVQDLWRCLGCRCSLLAPRKQTRCDFGHLFIRFVTFLIGESFRRSTCSAVQKQKGLLCQAAAWCDSEAAAIFQVAAFNFDHLENGSCFWKRAMRPPRLHSTAESSRAPKIFKVCNQ